VKVIELHYFKNISLLLILISFLAQAKKLKDQQVLDKKITEKTSFKGEKYDDCQNIKFVKEYQEKIYHLENFTCSRAIDERELFSNFEKIFGWGLSIERKVINIMKLDKKVLYDKVYYTDKSGFRRVDSNKSKAKSHLIIGGGSFVFGDGLNQNETVMHHLGLKYPKKNIYPIGLPGFSPAQTWLLFNQMKPRKWIKESEGDLVIMHFNFHRERICGSKSYLTWTSKKGPYLKKVNDKIEYQGSFKGMQNVVKNYACQDLLITFYQDLEKQYKRHFPKGKFHVIFGSIYADEDKSTDWKLATALKEKGLSVKNYLNGMTKKDEEKMKSRDYSYHIEGHPNLEGAKYLSRMIQSLL
jgi:hypothetical protein